MSKLVAPPEVPHVCIIPYEGYVKYETKGESGSEPCLGRPSRAVINDIKTRFIARDQRTTFEVIKP